ncbi:MAG: AIDA repeat-containing protein, partial [Lentisphaeria bacterium]|nr:AIDA repeat-containing protein [Lentisphaeria bacterium]
HSMYIMSGGKAISTTVNLSGYLYVSSGGTATATTVNSSGYLYVSSGGTATATTVNSWGNLYVSSGGTATSATVNYGGTLVLLNGGVVVDTIVNSGGILSISEGASATGIVADSTARLNINLSSETLVEGTIGGNAFMCSDGYVSGFTVANSSSYFSLSSGVVGSALTVVSTGVLFAHEGSFIDQLTVSRRGSAYIWGSANNATIYSSGSMTVYSGAYVNGVSVQEYGMLIINSGGAATVTGIVAHEDSGIFADITSQTRLIQGTHGDNAFTISNGSMGNVVVTFTPLVSEGGVLNSVTIIGNCYIGSGGSAGAITVSSEGQLTLSAGGSVSDLTLKKGARLGDFAFAEDIYVDSAVNRIEISAGVTVGGSSLSVASGYTVEKVSAFGDTARMYVDSGGVAENTVMSGGWMYASGVIRDTVVESGAFIYVYQDAVVSNLTVSAGGIVGGMVFAETRSWNYASGTLEAAENVSIAGAQMTVSSGGRAENIVASYGKLYVSSGGQIVSGGAKAAGEIFISSGGTAVDTFMSSGGHI